MESNNFVQASKLLHMQYGKGFWAGAFDPLHPDTQRHYELLSPSDGLLKHLDPSSILTIGDNLGRDAGYFKKLYPQSKCTASDLCVDGLQEAVSRGFIDDVISVDVEHIPFDDNKVDCVVAKEAFHHWPRPMLGVYEMLRVARKAVLLIEPYDVAYGAPLPYLLEESYSDQYEDVGNYKYQISLREMLKLAWSLYYPAVAASGFNDPYQPDRPYEEWIVEKRKLDQMGISGLRQFNLMAIAIYKPGFEPNSATFPLNARVYRRPINPFLE